MLFTSYEFLLFLGIVFLLYYIIPRKLQWPFLLLASYLFYFIANPWYLLYIMATTITVYLTAGAIERKKENFKDWYNSQKKQLDREQKKLVKEKEKKKEFHLLLLGLLMNLGLLAVVKYTNFAIANINSVFRLFGGNEISFMNIMVPMGISFYTFQSLGYLIDIYYGKYEAEKNPFRFALFVSFFPQLVQGPISRFHDLSKSLFEQHKAEWKTISFGLERILWGFFKKLVIADRTLPAVNLIIHNTDTYKGGFVLIGMLFYALELYADFTGGIDITIGTAQTLGIHITENFKRPYFSKNIKEYWKRWHITMGTWFTDYIFYPISVCQPMLKINKFSRKHFGNVIGKRVSVYLSSFVVWFTTGIWHGASWNFIAWGLGNFAVIMISQEFEPLYEKFHKKFHISDRLYYRMFQVIRTVLLMSCLRMFDCYRDVPLTFRMFGSMFADFRISNFSRENLLSLGLTGFDYLILAVGLMILITVSLLQRKGSIREQIAALKTPCRFAIWYGLFLTVLVFGAYGIGYDASQFIYNQF